MANTRDNNVIALDSTGAISGDVWRIKSFHYVGASSGSVILRSPDGSGKVVYEASGASDNSLDVGNLHVIGDLHVTVANGAKLYIYLK